METSKEDEPQLRHVETDVLIPKMMREKAKQRCAQLVDAFTVCCKDAGFFMVFKCREENAALKECLTRQSSCRLFFCDVQMNLFMCYSYQDPEFFQQCKQEYIQEKLEYERTGLPSKSRKQKLPTSM